MTSQAWRVAPLLFASGLCALVYQIAWLREFRLVFGASTAASAAVLAIFIGGLGFGGLLLGGRADRRRAPLLFYARLEAVIALSAAATPALLWLVRRTYVALGGTVVLGLGAGTAIRLLLAALVLGLPTLLMGGTLPAAARAVETDEDARRRAVALLYGVNTLGAVAGSFLATFFMLEALGTRRTLWAACLLNMAVALVARRLSATLPSAPPGLDAPAAAPRGAPAGFVLGSAAVVGFAFFLMEIVWYRMLGPLLGGSVFTFGLILCVALMGIGLGGACYSLFGQDRPATLLAFAYTCLLEAAGIALPLALGDRVATLALLLRPLGAAGFWGHVLGWTGVSMLVVFPAAFVAGYQFPLLVALLGRGRAEVGRQVGMTYAWNTAGAIAGSLAGGFGLLPALSAPGCWRLVSLLLVALGLLAGALSGASEGRRLRLLAPLGLAAATGMLLAAEGPTAAWRHSGIGAGRASANLSSPNGVRDWLHQERRALRWQTEGVESSVAVQARMGQAFAINGKIDGHFTLDAPTQVMSGLLAAILHPAPRSAMVIGLGTGSTAGWLGAIPGIERVDVAELERGVLEVARIASAVNHDVLRNPKVHIQLGDAREVLLTTPRRYDLVFSEPSNPYRAGIASLFTREYYRAVEERLRPGGLFVQWVQSYEVDGRSIRTIYATLRSVFPRVESWRTHRDLLLVASRQPIHYSAAALRERLAGTTYRAGLVNGWRAADLEGLLARYVAGAALADAVARQELRLNTDDRNPVEFGFARTVGRQGLFDLAELRELARRRGEDRPRFDEGEGDGEVDWERVEDERLRLYGEGALGGWSSLTAAQQSRVWAHHHYQAGNPAAALQAWRKQDREPSGPLELAIVAEGLAQGGDEAALGYIERLRVFQPVEAEAVLARLRRQQGRRDDAVRSLERAFERYRSDPWPAAEIMQRALTMARELAAEDYALGTRLYQALRARFAAGCLDEERTAAAAEIASRLDPRACAEALLAFEPHVPWRRGFLEGRLQCYEQAAHPRRVQAWRELAEFLSEAQEPFTSGLEPAAPSK